MMNYYWIAGILEEEEAEEKRKYELKNSDHGIGLLNVILTPIIIPLYDYFKLKISIM